MIVDTQDTVGSYLYYFGKWEPALSHWMASRLRAGDVFVDIGANLGYFTLLGAQLVGPSGKVVGIEPAPQIFSLLQQNVYLNHAHNVRCANVAAWNREEPLTLFTNPKISTGQTTVMPDWAARCGLDVRYQVSGVPFDRLLTPEEIAAVRLIKIDVEGAEWQVLSGLASLFDEFRPDVEIAIEVTHDPEDVLRLFRQHRFHCYQVENDYSGLSYLSAKTPKPPQRVDRICSKYADVIFSRVDALELSNS
jgi:FkbM family methyltransferase